MSLPAFSVKNTIFGNMLTIAVLGFGLFAAATMTRELFPQMDLDIVVVRTLYRNASPDEVEKQVTIPIEDEIRGIEGIDEFTSMSVENMSVIGIIIDPETKNKERVLNTISRKVDRVRNLPDGAEKPDIDVLEAGQEVIHVTVSGSAPESEIRECADDLKSRIEDMPGIGSVIRQGWRDPEVFVDVNPEKLYENELSLDEIVAAVARQNVNLPGGRMQEGTQDIILRTIGEFETAKDVEEVVVRSNADGKHIRVGDIAQISEGFSDDSIVMRANGSRGIILTVRKKLSGDAITTADSIVALVKKERETLQEGIQLGILDFESYVIKRRLKVLLGNGLMGLLLVLCALPLVLNFRLALVTAIGIPFAFLATILIMSWSGITINMMTMFGIILVVGMLVDDAIIVAENVFRHMEMGKPARQAAIDGTTEVMWPVTATILTTVAAFIPLLALPGIMGRVLQWVPIVVIITLAASLFESLVILPCHIADFVKGDAVKKQSEQPGRIRRKVQHIWGSLQGRYDGLLDRVLSHRGVFLLIVFAVFALALGYAKTSMKFEMFPDDLIEIFTVKLTMPEGTTRDATEAAAASIEQEIFSELDEAEHKNTITQVGQLTDNHGAYTTIGSRYATLFVYMTPAQERSRSVDTVMMKLEAKCQNIAAAETVLFEPLKGGPPVGKAIDIKIVGDDYRELEAVAEEMKVALRAFDVVTEVSDDYEPGKEELRVMVDRAEAARLGVSVESVARTVYTAFEGAVATVVRDTDEETNIRVRLAEPFSNEVKYLKTLRVRNHAGRLIELSRVAEIRKSRSSTSQILHFNGDRAISVTAGVRGGAKNQGAASKVNVAVWEQFKHIPEERPGIRIARTGEWEEQQLMVSAMIKAALTALALIYTILVIQFKSFLQPFVVLTSIPFGLIGVLVALAVHLKPISIMAMLGMVGMCGVVVNDAIVLVSFINDLRKEGVPAVEAIRRAAKTRFRPIVLTSVTTVLGMAPVIYGIGGYEPFVAPAAIVLAYGLVFSTVLTLLVVPCVYSLGLDLREKVRAALAIAGNCMGGIMRRGST